MQTLKHALVLTLIGSAVIISCAKKTETTTPTSDSVASSTITSTKTGIGTGVVKSINNEEQTILLKHNDIPNIMEAMEMSYHVEKPELLQNAGVGDSVTFELKERTQGDFVVSSIKVITKKKSQ